MLNKIATPSTYSATMEDNNITADDDKSRKFLAIATGGGGERLADSQDDFAADTTQTNKTTHINNATKSKIIGDSADVRNLQQQFFELSKENEMLKEVLEKIHKKSAPKCSCSDGHDGEAKIEEIMKDLKLETKDMPQISPLSDSDETTNEQVPRTIDISDRSGYSDMENEGKQKKFNYITSDDERPIDYFELYS